MSRRAEVSRTLSNKFGLVSLFIFCTLILAVTATTVQTDKTTYEPGETVTISGTCSSPAVPVGLRALLDDGETVWFDQVTTDSSKSYSGFFLPPQKGKYTITAACQGETGSSTEITVADTVAPQGQPPAGSSSDDSNGGSNGGGGGGCISQWEYSGWSKCNAALQQTRTAIHDKGKCINAKPQEKNLVRSCEVCEEDWTCSGWSVCVSGVQSRDCVDESQCGTTSIMPETTESCVIPTPQPPKKPLLPDLGEKIGSFWEDYKLWIIGVPLGIVVLLLLVLLLHALFKKKVVYDEQEVKQWARKERTAGTSAEDVKEIIHQYTHWKKEKVEQVLLGLK
ncbi:hypothetical protein J4210_06080 [Candidatus Woesearchaeota archaeon]|nr:hypothetical protein [Candidatus Woesearchaeota archaeon]